MIASARSRHAWLPRSSEQSDGSESSPFFKQNAYNPLNDWMCLASFPCVQYVKIFSSPTAGLFMGFPAYFFLYSRGIHGMVLAFIFWALRMHVCVDNNICQQSVFLPSAGNVDGVWHRRTSCRDSLPQATKEGGMVPAEGCCGVRYRLSPEAGKTGSLK